MAGMGIDGLASGLDTTSLINQLMQVEAMPQTLLKQKSTATQSVVTALQGLNTKIASLAEAATSAAKPASWQVFTATSSATSVTATAGATAQPGSLTFSVDRLATSQVTLSASVLDDGTDLLGGATSLTVRKHDGTLVTVTPTTGKLADVAKAINDSATAGVRASVVSVPAEPTDPAGTQRFRLQLTGAETGGANAFAVYAGTVSQADIDANMARLDGTAVRTAVDAQVTLWKGAGVGVETTLPSASNTFAGLMTGVDITVSAVTPAGEDATVTVGRDDEALKKLASGLVGALGVVFSEISSRTATTTKTGTDGKTSVTGGILSGDSAVRGIQQQLVQAASYPVDGASPSTIGIVLGRDGTFTFDDARFTAALAEDPAKVQSMLTQLAQRVADVGTGISDKVDGTLTRKIQGQESLVKDYGNQIESWDRRLELRRASLQKTYSALEVSLSKMQSQSSWLAGQLAGLSTSNGS